MIELVRFAVVPVVPWVKPALASLDITLAARPFALDPIALAPFFTSTVVAELPVLGAFVLVGLEVEPTLLGGGVPPPVAPFTNAAIWAGLTSIALGLPSPFP